MDGQLVGNQHSPFLLVGSTAGQQNTPRWIVKKYLETAPICEDYRKDFMALGPDQKGFATGTQVKPDLVNVSGLPSSVLHRYEWMERDIEC